MGLLQSCSGAGMGSKSVAAIQPDVLCRACLIAGMAAGSMAVASSAATANDERKRRGQAKSLEAASSIHICK